MRKSPISCPRGYFTRFMYGLLSPVPSKLSQVWKTVAYIQTMVVFWREWDSTSIHKRVWHFLFTNQTNSKVSVNGPHTRWYTKLLTLWKTHKQGFKQSENMLHARRLHMLYNVAHNHPSKFVKSLMLHNPTLEFRNRVALRLCALQVNGPQFVLNGPQSVVNHPSIDNVITETIEFVKSRRRYRQRYRIQMI